MLKTARALVNNAGISPFCDFLDIDEAFFDKVHGARDVTGALLAVDGGFLSA